MSLEYEKQKYKVIKKMVDEYHQELLKDRDVALDMPIETDNGFNVERETLIDDIDEKLEILRRHSSEPYFAKLHFIDKSDNEEFNGYIGRLSIGDVTNKSDEKVVDWRAPISDLYYNGRLGDSEYKAHGDIFQVDLKLKRQIDIKNNEVRSIYDFEEAVSSDEFLKPYLTQSADNRLKNIVATIQGEQNEIIRQPVFQNCIVQGVAGSGKTTVALHRLSYLIYNFKKSIRPEEFLIISPNEIFMSYISSILVDLDADKSNSFSLNKLFDSIIGTNYKILSKHEQYRKLNSLGVSTKYLAYKNSKEFASVVRKFVDYYIYKTYHQPLVIKGVEVLDADTVYSFYNNHRKDITITNLAVFGSRQLALALKYEGKIRDKAMININNSGIDLMDKFAIKRLLDSDKHAYLKKNIKSNFDIFKLYTEFIKDIDKFSDFEEIDILQKYTLENLKKKVVAYDDLASILYIASYFNEMQYYNNLKCVFIDEAQDLSVLMYMALRKAFPNAKFSIFGDIAQGIYSYQSIANWTEVEDIITDSKLLLLKRSYRTTVEIMEDANNTLSKLGFPPATNVIRHGDKVERIGENDVDVIAKELEVLNKNYLHTAIIVKDDYELKQAQKKLEKLNLVVLDENNISYSDVKNALLTVQTAKGLEFDSVIIYNEKSYTESDIDLKLLYVAKTRALHKLIINSEK